MSTEENPEIKDYREDTDIARVHASVTREKDDLVTRKENPPSWVFVVCALIFIGGGTYLGAYSGGFRNDVSDPFEAVHVQDPRIQQGPQEEVVRDIGKEAFLACAACHMPNGAGSATVPPLAGSEWVNGSTERLANIILRGLSGPIEVKGTQWNSVMPAQQMTAEKLAAVMNYVRNNFGNESNFEVTEAMAAKVMKELKGQPAVTSDILKSIPEDQQLTE